LGDLSGKWSKGLPYKVEVLAFEALTSKELEKSEKSEVLKKREKLGVGSQDFLK